MNLRDDKRRNIQDMDFPLSDTGEARGPVKGGAESSQTAHESESPASTNRLMEEICEWKNLKEAVHQVWANKGSAGIDGRGIDQLPGYRELESIREQLLRGTYEPQPVKRVEIPKPDGGMRKLGIPTVLDRIVQQAVMQVLQKRWDRTFSDNSYGFRPGRSAHQAVARAQEYIAQGHGWVVDMDLEKFFDRVNHDKLMGQLAKRIQDKRLLKLIRAFLNAGVMDNGLVSPSVEGTPQGGPLSPLLSNIVLDALDRELERRGHCFVRYADDCNIYVRSERAGQRVMDGVTRFITRKLKLKVNEAKSAVARPQKRKFLGFSFTIGREIRCRIAPKSIARFKQRIREDHTVRPERGHEDDPGGTGALYEGLAKLLRLLRNAECAGESHALGPAPTPLRLVATVEDAAPPVGPPCSNWASATRWQAGRPPAVGARGLCPIPKPCRWAFRTRTSAQLGLPSLVEGC